MRFSPPAGVPRRRVVTIWCVGLLLLFGLPLAERVYQVPIQASEVVDIVEYVNEAPGVGAAFTIGLHASRTMLRPLRQVHTKLLLEAADATGGRYHLVFRGVHALLAVVLVGLFITAARPRSSTDLAALAFALTVLVGLHTFLGMVREAYPVNHFLVVAMYGLATLAVAQSRGGILADIAVALFVVLALFTLESGVLVAVVAFAAYVAGLRGISRRGLAFVSAVVVGYVCLRVGYWHIESPAFAERATGFGLGALSSAEQLEQFGDRRWVLYLYNTVCALLSVLGSQPREGTWTLATRWSAGDVPPWMIVHVMASAIVTGFIACFAVARQSDGRRGWRDPLLATAAMVIAANAVLSYSYSKDEIVSFAGVFYALASYAAMRVWLQRAPELPWRSRSLAATLALVAAVLWSVRVVGTHHILREQASQVRTDWAYFKHEPSQQSRALIMALRSEAFAVKTTSPRLISPIVKAWFGER